MLQAELASAQGRVARLESDLTAWEAAVEGRDTELRNLQACACSWTPICAPGSRMLLSSRQTLGLLSVAWSLSLFSRLLASNPACVALVRMLSACLGPRIRPASAWLGVQVILAELSSSSEAADRVRAEQRALQRQLAETGAQLTAAQVSGPALARLLWPAIS